MYVNMFACMFVLMLRFALLLTIQYNTRHPTRHYVKTALQLVAYHRRMLASVCMRENLQTMLSTYRENMLFNDVMILKEI